MLQKLIFVFTLIFLSGTIKAQSDCLLILTGQVIDDHDDQPLVGAVVRLNDEVTTTNNDGFFVFTNLCADTYAIAISHVLCDEISEKITINNSIQKTFYLEHHEDLLEEIEVEAIANRGEESKASTTLTDEDLINKKGKSFSELLENVEGISLLKTGATITKPVINGLHSQRILMVNQGMRMEGQQWGIEHAPDIDPNTVQVLSIIQGAGSVEYGADALGGVVLIEPALLPDKYGITYRPSLNAFSNGRGGSIALDILGKQKLLGIPLSFQAQGSIKKTGNLKAPEYYLDNTGVEQENFMLRGGYVGDNAGIEFRLSQFNNELGILTDSHIGNRTDLEAIIENGRPFTDRGFSYDILRPRQKILHEIAQTKGYWNTKLGEVEMNLSRQYNRRSEFDRSETEAGLRLKTETFTEEISLNHHLGKNWNGKGGIQLQQQTYKADGFYLIPEYDQDSFGIYLHESYEWNDKWVSEAGIRYDKKDYTYYLPFNDFTRLDESNITYDEIDGNIGIVNTSFDDLLTGSFGLSFYANDNLKFSSYVGYGARQPLPNELYSDGVHHGTALWEVGDPNLAIENATNIQLNSTFNKANSYFNLSLFNNIIDNYSYLLPSQDLEPITTIRGVFPVYETRQSDVNMAGANYTFKQNNIFEKLAFSTSGSLLWAEDKTINDALIFMPANRLNHQLRYAKNDHSFFSIGIQNVFEQKRIPDENVIKDYVSPPPGYTLFNAQYGQNIELGNNPLSLSLSLENITNKEYKEYLDRFRYFASAPGINFGINATYTINQ